MNLVNTNCPNCGANLEVDTERGYCFCEYCGSKILIDDDDNEIHIHADNAEQAGYDFERGRQRAQEEYNNGGQQAYRTTEETPRRRNTLLWVLGWIFIFPLPLTLLMLRNQTLPKWVRILIIVAAWVVYVFLFIRNGAS